MVFLISCRKVFFSLHLKYNPSSLNLAHITLCERAPMHPQTSSHITPFLTQAALASFLLQSMAGPLLTPALSCLQAVP